MERVLVGVDVSQAARRALRWALDEARCHEAALHVVLVAAPVYLYGSEAPYWADRDEIIEEAQSQLDSTVEDCDRRRCRRGRRTADRGW